MRFKRSSLELALLGGLGCGWMAGMALLLGASTSGPGHFVRVLNPSMMLRIGSVRSAAATTSRVETSVSSVAQQSPPRPRNCDGP